MFKMFMLLQIQNAFSLINFVALLLGDYFTEECFLDRHWMSALSLDQRPLPRSLTLIV